MQLEGALALRGDQPVGRYCPIERVLGLISTRSSILLLREAFYGATRFETFAARTGLTEATTAKKLRDFVDAGVLETQPYQRPGERRRAEYVLTESGRDLLPAVFALLQWGNAHDPPPYPPSLHHQGCGEPVEIVARCSAGHEVGGDDIVVSAPGPFGLDDPQEP
ncbi:winged helix-turn-helix transcriptional regulator [Georgenia faecalis]|uniref:winged helix-turn-helix transcriptional regulator n=1 Tax=Georgenia faecalis TaxID=2483799 RepID=UPI000FD75FE6|nr:helix-turn-helix domain-containing protein [Georgenia faecalis]